MDAAAFQIAKHSFGGYGCPEKLKEDRKHWFRRLFGNFLAVQKVTRPMESVDPINKTQNVYSPNLSHPFVIKRQLETTMTKYGYTEAKLQQEYDLVNQVIALELKQKKEKGESEQATRTWDEKMDELAVYISEMRSIAKVALSNTPDYLEKLGIMARSAGFTPRKPKEIAATKEITD